MGFSSPPGFSQQPMYAPKVDGSNQAAQQDVSGPVSSSVGQSGSNPAGHETLLPNAFSVMTLQDLASGNWNMDTGSSSHFNDLVSSLSNVFNIYLYPSVSIGDGYFIPVTNSGHSVLPTPHRPIRLNNVLITPNIVKNLIYVHHFVHDICCTVEFDVFGFFVKDFLTRRVLLRCDSTGDLYPITKPSTIPHPFLTNKYTWHQRLGHPGSEVLRRLLSSNLISCNKEKPPVFCHVCQLGKHVRLPFVNSSTLVKSCFDIVHSDLWTSEFRVFLVLNTMFNFWIIIRNIFGFIR
ncbi:ribonuclease H-like domain-containing protein [Tanacetum coccineum]